MERSDVMSGLALLISTVLLILFIATAQSSRARMSDHQMALMEKLTVLIDEKTAQSNQILREEMERQLYMLAMNEVEAVPTMTAAEFKKLAHESINDPILDNLLRRSLESVLLNQMAHELASVDWDDALSQEKLKKLVDKAVRSSSGIFPSMSMSRIDVSDIQGVEAKVNRILEEFEGVNSYSHNNALVQQIAGLGSEAIEPLLTRLSTASVASWAVKSAIEDALGKLLTEEHESIILEQFAKRGSFARLIKKYHFTAAENELITKIQYPINGYLDSAVVDAALSINAERSIPFLFDYVKHGQNVAYVAQQLANEGIDITEPLIMAANRPSSIWEKAGLAKLCFEYNLPESYDLAVAVLRSNAEHAEHAQQQVYDHVRKYIGVKGSYAEVADWLEQTKPR
jgi:hypothetical protein